MSRVSTELTATELFFRFTTFFACREGETDICIRSRHWRRVVPCGEYDSHLFELVPPFGRINVERRSAGSRVATVEPTVGRSRLRKFIRVDVLHVY